MEIRKLNYRAGWLVADYLNEQPCSITPELMASVLPEGADAATEQYVYAALLGGLMGLDTEQSAEDRFIADQYLRRGLQRLDAARWRENAYYRNIRIEPCSRDGWALAWQRYQPYELFLRDDLILTDDLRQIPAIGYFSEPFSYPSVLQDGREWMSIKPSEIASSQAAVDAAAGSVLTFGLGLGYFAYMVARKPEVASVTVVERDPTVISLFQEQILPQIPERAKISVIQADAFDYLDHQMNSAQPDFVFMDIWHDIADGTPLYVRAKQYEPRFPHTRFTYWIERSLRCALLSELEHRV
ncbi:MAG: hypothetical protein IKX53_03150 [Bacteroidales bacterium]|nr:hypothetical protein [Bacteroidales bacterium]